MSVATHPRLTAEHPSARRCFLTLAEMCGSILAHLTRHPVESGPESSVATHACR